MQSKYNSKIIYATSLIIILFIFVFDIISYFSRYTITLHLYIKELLIIFAFIILIPLIMRSKWSINKSIIFKIKSLCISIVSIYIFFFLLRALLAPDFNFETAIATHSYTSLSLLFFSTLTAICTTIFCLFIILILRDLIYFKRTSNTHRNFRIIILICFTQILYFNFISQTNQITTNIAGNKTTIGTILLILLIMIMVINSFRSQWINYLNKRQKLACFAWSIVLLPIPFFLLNMDYLQIVSIYSISLSVFFKQITLFLSIYWSMVILHVLVNLPTAGLQDRKKKEIASLQELSRTIKHEFNPDKLISLITKQSTEVIKANAVWLELIDDTTAKCCIVSSTNLSDKEISQIINKLDKNISDWILTHQKSVLVNDISMDDRTRYLKQIKKNIGSLLGVPLISFEKFIGILFAVKIEEYGFDIDEKDMLQTFADQAAVALENARLVKESILKERYEQELKIAHEAQMKLLPKEIPAIPNLDIDAILITANEVGGDYYDFFILSDHQLAIVIGDVSGKGPEAAFYMAEVKGIIESLSRIYSSPKEILINANKILYDNLESNMFVTLIDSIIDTELMKLTFSRAGHCPLIYYDANSKKAKLIEPKGFGLGIESGNKFGKFLKEINISLNTNDVLLFFTDGVVEARNKKQEEFGEDQLLDIVQEFAYLNASEIKNKIVDKVHLFADPSKSNDDLTMVIVKIT